MHQPRIIPVVFASCLFTAVHCDDDRTVTAPTMAAIESVQPVVDAAPVAPERPMPASSCGGLIGNNVCDPVTGWPCDVAAGEFCDYAGISGFFECFPARPGPTAGFCDSCGFAGPSCAAGLTCSYLDTCERFCCADSDCGLGSCLFDVFGDPKVAAIGFCLDESTVVCRGSGDAGSEQVPDAPNAPPSAVDASAPPPVADAGSAP